MKFSTHTFAHSLVMTLALSAGALAQNGHPEIRILFPPVGGEKSLDTVKELYQKPIKNGTDKFIPTVRMIIAPMPDNSEQNPFGVTRLTFEMGLSRPSAVSLQGEPPTVDAKSLRWFDHLLDPNLTPNVFHISGHQVAGMGFHSNEEDPEVVLRNLFIPTLLRTLRNYSPARQVFDNVKVAIMGGCNSMTNFEPHGPEGEYLTSQQIESIYNSGEEGRRAVTGGSEVVNSLEYYRNRLASVYPKDYVRSPRPDVCETYDPHSKCSVLNLDRVLSDRLLFDGSHSLNYPAMLAEMFPNAVLVLGYSSPSPYHNKDAAKILREALKHAEGVINGKMNRDNPRYISNPLYAITNNDLTESHRKEIIQAIRRSWTLTTAKMNKEPVTGKMRPAGSITPAYPDLDNDGPFPVYASERTPTCAPYRPGTKPCSNPQRGANGPVVTLR